MDFSIWEETSPYLILFWSVCVAFTVVGLWKTFAKAGEPGWAAVVPIYDLWVLARIAGRPAWWSLVIFACSFLAWIPVVGRVLVVVAAAMYLLICIDLARNFGEDAQFGFGLWLLPFAVYIFLGFGDQEFRPVTGRTSAHPRGISGR